MADLTFDDLVPGGGGQGGSGQGGSGQGGSGQGGDVSFDDLVPPETTKKTLREQAYEGSILQPFVDATNLSMDAVTRGFGSKLFGDQDEVARSRERLPAAVTVPVDIASYAASAPYHVTSALAGTGI